MEASVTTPQFVGRDYKEKKITGKVSHLYGNPTDTWSAGIITADSDTGSILDRDCRFKAPCRLQMGETVTLHGAWVNDRKWGWQFHAKLVEYPMPAASADGLASYLANNPAFHGIGPAKAQKIAEAFGESFDQVIRDNPEAVAQAGKITLDQALTIQREWCERADVNAISMWLASFGLTHAQIKRIAAQYGNRAQQVLSENPYLLCNEVHGFGFARTDEIALKMGIVTDHPGRICACLVDVAKQEADGQGHTWIDRADLLRSAINKLALDSLDAEQIVAMQLDMLTGNASEFADIADFTSPLIAVDDLWQTRIAFRKVYEREQALLSWFHKAETLPVTTIGEVNTLIDEACAASDRTPTTAQREAIRMAVTSRISVLSGSAGTGKSFTVGTVRKCFALQGLCVAMAAPTGKAARRMSQSSGGAIAKTIHRLLEYSPLMGWTYNENNKLPYDLVIIDEVSMCDITLLWRLFRAIDLNSTQVLLVGDHNQLPPIGAGNVLRDVLDHKILPQAVLTQCHRAAGQLKANCTALLTGTVNPTTPVLPAGGREWRVIDNIDDTTLVINSLKMLMTDKFASWGFDPIADCQIITPQNKGKLGVNRINAELQRVWQKIKYNEDLPEVPETDEPRIRIRVGDKVMQIKNDYKLGEFGVMNGTQGVVRSIETRGNKSYWAIQFDDQPEPVEIEQGSDQAANIVLAYAVTIHKVQGSEYLCVVAVIHSQHRYMLSRNLLYTAATRARTTAILIGNRLGFRHAAKTTTPTERRTWMALASCASDQGVV